MARCVNNRSHNHNHTIPQNCVDREMELLFKFQKSRRIKVMDHRSQKNL